MFEKQSPSKLDKHRIVTKLQKVLEIKNDFETLDDTNVLIVDFKSLLHRLPMKKFQNLQQELLAAGWKYIKNVSKFNKIHIVCDSYFSDSLKNVKEKLVNL